MTDIKGKPTFAQLVILGRVAQKRAMSQKPAGFQDYMEHTDYTAYSDYGDSHSDWLSGGDCEFYDDACVVVPKAPDHETDIKPAKWPLLQRIFGNRR